jgi:hypothetical protein
MVVAGAIAEWYFTPRGAAKRAIEKAVKNGGGTEWSKRALEVNDSCCPLLSSTGRVLRFHMGTVAVAAFVVAVVQFIRFVLLYIMAKREQAGEVSRVEKALFACLNCCAACLEKCLEKISKNSLIWCATRCSRTPNPILFSAEPLMYHHINYFLTSQVRDLWRQLL